MIKLIFDFKFEEFKKFQTLFDKGLYKKALTSLETEFKADLSNEQKYKYLILKGIVSYELGEYKQSEELLDLDQLNVSEINPRLYYLGLIYKAMVLTRTARLNNAIITLNSLLPDIFLLKDQKLESLVYNWLGNSY